MKLSLLPREIIPGLSSSFFNMALAATFAVLTLSPGARAADSTASDANTSSVRLPASNGAIRSDIDQEITNARLRATTGSKSLVSFQSEFNYNGSTVQDPLSKERPQLSASNVENDPAKLTGRVSLKYRMSDHNNLNLGFGLGWITPSYEGQRGQAESPYVAYGRVFKVGSVQNVFDAQVLKYTATKSVEESELNYETTIDHTVIVPIGSTPLQLGGWVGWSREVYSASNNGVQDQLYVFPLAEYEINKRFSLRTVYRAVTYYNLRSKPNVFIWDDSTESLGVGITATRDLYFYPNVQWVWGDMRPEKTNVALTANINL